VCTLAYIHHQPPPHYFTSQRTQHHSLTSAFEGGKLLEMTRNGLIGPTSPLFFDTFIATMCY
jgi:hypothetical protein